MKTLDRLPIQEKRTSLRFGDKFATIHRNQVLVWVSVHLDGVDEPEENIPKFPALLDTGNNVDFSVQHRHLREWAGIDPELLAVLGDVEINGDVVTRREATCVFLEGTITMTKYTLSLASVILAMATVCARAERHIYVADHDVRKVLKIKEDGTVLWEARNNNGHDVQVLANGNVLVNCPPSVREYAPDGRIVWEAGKEVAADPESAQRLANGHTLIADNAKHRVIEIDADKKIVWSFDVPNSNHRPNPTMRQVRRLDNGNTLICASTLDKVIEVSPSGTVVWEFTVPFPYLATRLADGHTIVSSGDGYGSPRGFFVIEIDNDGKIVWKYGGDDAPTDQKLNWPSGFVRLPDGHTLISEARAGTIREVSRDKKLVRTIKSPAMRHPCTLVVVEE